MNTIHKLVLLFVVAIAITACSSDDNDGPETSPLTLNILHLEALEGGSTYEGWVITPTGAVSTGKFTSVNFPQTFNVVSESLAVATGFVLSIEPANDTDEGPSNTKILKGSFVGNSASLEINGVVEDFSAVSGAFIMATPTDTDATNDANGIWFIDPSSGTMEAGLDLPDLSASSGWKYEGWVVENGIPVSTGTFLSANGSDDFSPYSGNQDAPSFPGEDFLNASVAPSGVVFPLDVKEKNVVITVEPSPDTGSAPFFLKPLVGLAGQETAPVLNTMDLNSASFPIGTASK